MFFWTHIFDLLAKIVCMALAMAMFLFLLSMSDPPAKVNPVIFILCFTAAGVIWWVWLRTLASWLHARVRLGARLSWGQARRASMLFSPVRDMLHWHPLWEVRQLPEEQRVAAIEEAMNRLQAELQAKAARLRAAPAVSHAFRWLQWVVVAVGVVLTFANLPPASWVSEFQAQKFDGAYHPLLTFVILVFPVTGVLRWLEHATDARSVVVSNPPPDDAAEPPASAFTVTTPVEQVKVVDPNDHSRFAPPSR